MKKPEMLKNTFSNPLEMSISQDDDSRIPRERAFDVEGALASPPTSATFERDDLDAESTAAEAFEAEGAERRAEGVGSDKTNSAKGSRGSSSRSPAPHRKSSSSPVFDQPSFDSEQELGTKKTKAAKELNHSRDDEAEGGRQWGAWSAQAALAGCMTGINSFVDSLAIGCILFSGEYSSQRVDIAVKHALIGCIVAQIANGCLSGYSKLITPNGWELLPFIMALFRSKCPTYLGSNDRDYSTSRDVPIHLTCPFNGAF